MNEDNGRSVVAITKECSTVPPLRDGFDPWLAEVEATGQWTFVVPYASVLNGVVRRKFDPTAREQSHLIVGATVTPIPPPIPFAIGPAEVIERNIARGDYQSVMQPWSGDLDRYELRAYRMGVEVDYISRSRLEQCRDAEAFSPERGQLRNDFAMCSLNRPERSIYMKFRVSTALLSRLPEIFSVVDSLADKVSARCLEK